jgi:CheY-like chemotaxis protein
MNNMPTACVIDDDQIYTYIVRRMMEQNNLAFGKTLYFENGKTALDYFTENIDQPDLMPDLILLDLNMPVLDGWEFLDEYVKMLPRIDKKMSLYIVSSSIDDADHSRAKGIQTVSDFIVKPVNTSMLQGILAKWNQN